MSERRFNGESGEIMNFDYSWKTSWEFKTDISETIGGNEQRRARWSRPLRIYSIPFNNKTTANMNTLKKFFYDHQGQYDSFLFYDPSSRNTWVIPDGSKVTSGTDVKKIYLPFQNLYPLDSTPSYGTASANVRVYVSGTEVTSNLVFSATTGVITWTYGFPTSTQAIQVDYEYYVRVRFNSDTIEVTEQRHNLQSATIELKEVR